METDWSYLVKYIFEMYTYNCPSLSVGMQKYRIPSSSNQKCRKANTSEKRGQNILKKKDQI